MRQIEVMLHTKIGGIDETDPNIPSNVHPPKWINHWVTANVLATLPGFLYISIPELNYAGWTDVWYTREVECNWGYFEVEK